MLAAVGLYRRNELALGTSVIVCYSYKEKKPVPVPEHWLAGMKAV